MQNACFPTQTARNSWNAMFEQVISNKKCLKEIKAFINSIPLCEGTKGTTKSTKRKRKPSAYNKFIGGCVSPTKSLTECASEWSANKK